MKMKYNLKILENANKLIESIACDSLAQGERTSDRWKVHYYVSTYCCESNNGLERKRLREKH